MLQIAANEKKAHENWVSLAWVAFFVLLVPQHTSHFCFYGECAQVHNCEMDVEIIWAEGGIVP